MVRSSKWMFLGTGALTGLLTMWSSLAGCQGGTSAATGGDTTGSGGTGGAGTTTGANTGGSTGTDTTSSSSTGAGGGGETVAAVNDVTGDPTSKNKVGQGLPVKLPGVIAMSQKFLVSGPGTTGNCLWGVFVSAPGLTETQPYSGVLAIAKNGFPGAIVGDAGKAFCPKLGTDPTGDSIPDDVKPGDVLDIIGQTDAYVSSSCGANPGETKIPGTQVSNVTSVVRTSTMPGPVPTPHVMTAAEIPQLAAGGVIPGQNGQPPTLDPAVVAFHQKWGGVKVAVQNVVSEAQMANGVTGIVDGFGHMLVHDVGNAAPTQADKLQVGDKLYYRAYLKKSNFCYSGPVYADPVTTFTSIEGFHYLDFCTWGLSPNNKCADIAPPSPDAADCNSNAGSCP